MEYLHDGLAHYPLRLGHEWCGTVSAVGAGVDESWLGRRTTGDTQLGCGHCHRCLTGRQHVCDDRSEIGLRRGFHGALAEQLAVPVTALLPLPDTVDDVAGALVEPGGNALRAVRAAEVEPGERLLVLGPGTIGLLAARFALAQGCEVHVVGRQRPLARLRDRRSGSTGAWTTRTLPDLPLGRRHRRLQPHRIPRPRRRARRRRPPRRLHRAVGGPEPAGHPDPGA